MPALSMRCLRPCVAHAQAAQTHMSSCYATPGVHDRSRSILHSPNEGAQPCDHCHRQREEVFYGDEERNALTLHFESSEQTRLFGSPAFIYFPTAAWQDYYWSKVSTATSALPSPASSWLRHCGMA